MEAKVTAILTDERGWQKTFDLTEGIYWAGSAAKAHIRLADGDGIPPYLLQIVNRNAEASVRVINLSQQELAVQKGGESSLLAPRQMVDVFGPEILHTNGYTLQFKLDKQSVAQPATGETRQQLIGLRLVLSDVVLRPNQAVTGSLTLQNLGNLACQFRVSIDGVPAGCLELSPPPLIHPGGEENTQFRIHHRQSSPPAGPLRLVLRVSAPEVYPGAEVTLHQVLQVVPVYAHSIVIEPLAAEVAAARTAAANPAVENPAALPANGKNLVPAPPNTVAAQALEPVAYESFPPILPGAMFGEPVVTRAEYEADLEDDMPVYPMVKDIRPEPGMEAPVLAEDATTVSQPDVLMPIREPAPAIASPASVPTPLAETSPEPREVQIPLRRARRPDLDLGSVKKIQANSGEFLEKRTDQE